MITFTQKLLLFFQQFGLIIFPITLSVYHKCFALDFEGIHRFSVCEI